MSLNTRAPLSLPTVRAVCVLALAALFDACFGDPPNAWHPVAWMGRAIGAARAHAPRAGRAGPLLYGGALSAAGLTTTALAGHLMTRLCDRLAGAGWPLLGMMAEAWLLKLMFSVRGLARAAQAVLRPLQHGDGPAGLEEARRRLAWHLVSRDTRALTEAQVCSAVIESVAENLCDSVVAPLCYYAWGGLPAAWAYRFANTADAMLGYHDPEREWLGKFPARLDDALNLAPARLSAALLWLAGALAGADVRQGWRVWRRDAGLTASPNAGHAMSMMAGLLGVELEKVAHYRLGSGLRQPAPPDVARAIRIMKIAAGLSVIVCAALVAPARRLRKEQR